MSFLHLSLLAGVAAVAVPVMLHLFGQRQPQAINFPALRFVRQTRQEQSTSWQLRHFLLLLLRILLLAALAVALARPRVHSVNLDSILAVSTLGLFAALASLIAAVAFATRRPASVWMTSSVIALALWAGSALWGYRSLTSGPPVPSQDQSAPVAATLIVDNGPTMSYRAENEVRLDRAKDYAHWILDQLPVSSKVGILGGSPVGSLSLDPASAGAQIKLIEPAGAHIDLLARLRAALDLVLASELERKEIYLITDLMAASWASAQPGLKEMLDQHAGMVLVQIIDVGSGQQKNWSLGDPQVDMQSVTVGQDVEISVSVNRPDDSESNTTVAVELIQEAIDPRLPVIRNGELVTAPATVVDRRVVDLSAQASSVVKLTARKLSEGTHHFTVRMDKSDPLPVDNQRYVSIVARPRQPTLIVAEDMDVAGTLQLIADPYQEATDAQLEHIRYTQLPRADLSRFKLLWLHDPPPIGSQSAEAIRSFVEQGGGLLIVLGPGLGPVESIRGNPVLSLLPGQLGSVVVRQPSNRNAFLAPVALSHPIFHDLGPLVAQQLWNPFPVFRNWTFQSLAAEASKVMELSDDRSPAVVSENLGRGQIITFTTPIPHFEQRGLPLWNELWISDDPVPAFGLLRGALDALYGVSQESMNFQVNTPVTLRTETSRRPTRYVLYLPNAQTRNPPVSDNGQLDIGALSQAGTYRLRGLTGESVVYGFSINTPAADTQLERLDPSLLDDQLGADNYKVARSRDEIESSVGQARFGRELYPLLMLAVASLFLAEQAMSNRFYKLKFR
jgi:hypothetical protein